MSYRAVLVVAAVACLQTLAPESAQTAVRISDLTVGRYEKLELTVPCLYPLDFSDISCDHWAADAIAACSEADIVRGYPDGSYRPSFAVSREQMAVYVSRALARGIARPTGEPGLATYLPLI